MHCHHSWYVRLIDDHFGIFTFGQNQLTASKHPLLASSITDCASILKFKYTQYYYWYLWYIHWSHSLVVCVCVVEYDRRTVCMRRIRRQNIHITWWCFFFYFSRIWCACERDALMVKTKTNLFYIRKMVVCSAIVKKKTVPTSTFDRLMVCVESGRGENARTCAPMHCASIVY